MKNIALALTLLTTMFATSAQATQYIAVNGGVWDVSDDNSEWQYGVEWRGEEIMWNFLPIVGLTGTEEGAVYGYAGLNLDLPLFDTGFYLTPNFAVGAYTAGDSKDLSGGGALEFRSGLELSYQFESQYRLGVIVNHLSNARLHDKNPGEESVLVTFAVPLNGLFD